MDFRATDEAVPNAAASAEFAGRLLRTLVEATKVSNGLPGPEQHAYSSSFPAYNDAMFSVSSRLTTMLQGFMEQQQVAHEAHSLQRLLSVEKRTQAVAEGQQQMRAPHSEQSACDDGRLPPRRAHSVAAARQPAPARQRWRLALRPWSARAPRRGDAE